MLDGRVDELKIEEFFERGQFLVAPGKEQESEYACCFWDDAHEVQQFYLENPELHPYTIVEEENKWYITPGLHRVNVIAWMLSVHDAGLEEGEYLLYAIFE